MFFNMHYSSVCTEQNKTHTKTFLPGHFLDLSVLTLHFAFWWGRGVSQRLSLFGVAGLWVGCCFLFCFFLSSLQQPPCAVDMWRLGKKPLGCRGESSSSSLGSGWWKFSLPVLVLLTSVMRPTFCPAASPVWFGFGWSLPLLFDILSSTHLFIYISPRHRETAAFYCSRKCGADKSSENSQLQRSFVARLLFLPDAIV